MAKKNRNTDNQTQFSQEGAVLEEQQEELLFEPTAEDGKPFFKTKKGVLMIVGGLAFIFLVLVLVIASIIGNSNKKPIDQAQEQPPVQQQSSDDPLQQELNQLKSELEQADPSKRELPFPQIELEINLEQD